MKNRQLAQWLQEHTEMLGRIADSPDDAFHAALYESLIDMAEHGQTHMVDSILESAAAHAVAIGRGLTDLLSVPQLLRERIWQRIGEEVDPEPAFGLLTDVDAAFVYIIRLIIDAYEETSKLATAAKASEISRLYTDSERKVMEYAIEVSRANRELAQLEQAKTDFIGIAAHELKTPLTLIQGYVDIMAELGLGEEVTSLVNGIHRGATRMNAILDNMLDLSAIDLDQLRLVVEPVNLSTLVGLTLAQVERVLTERQQQVETAGLDELPTIQGDRQRLHQVLRQLISNAIKYTPDGGCIVISGQGLPGSGTRPGQVQLTIRDSGVGIAPEDRDKIFQKFYRVGSADLHSTSDTKFMGAGPGLGLAIAKGLVEAHGGKIWAESPGFDPQNTPGSSFHLLLPLQVQPPPGIEIEYPDKPGQKSKTAVA